MNYDSTLTLLLGVSFIAACASSDRGDPVVGDAAAEDPAVGDPAIRTCVTGVWTTPERACECDPVTTAECASPTCSQTTVYGFREDQVFFNARVQFTQVANATLSIPDNVVFRGEWSVEDGELSRVVGFTPTPATWTARCTSRELEWGPTTLVRASPQLEAVVQARWDEEDWTSVPLD